MLEMALRSLMNLSTTTPNQKRICRAALPLLMALMGLASPLDVATAGAQLRALTCDILQNLFLNKDNVTDLYRVRPEPSLGKPPPRKQAQGSSKNRVLKWRVHPLAACGAVTLCCSPPRAGKSEP